MDEEKKDKLKNKNKKKKEKKKKKKEESWGERTRRYSKKAELRIDSVELPVSSWA